MNANHLLEQALADSAALTAATIRYAEASERAARMAEALTVQNEVVGQLMAAVLQQRAEASNQQLAALAEQSAALRDLMVLSERCAQQAAGSVAPPNAPLPGDH